MIKSLPFLQGASLQVIHLSGARDERLVADNYHRENVPAYVAAFYHRMEEVYSVADLLVARSGAASLAEFAAFSLPSILIPFPYATDDHQTRNAEIYARARAQCQRLRQSKHARDGSIATLRSAFLSTASRGGCQRRRSDRVFLCDQDR